MNADRVIKSNTEFFNTGTWAGGTWRRNIVWARGDNVQAAMGSNSLEWNPADTGNCPKPSDPQPDRAGVRSRCRNVPDSPVLKRWLNKRGRISSPGGMGPVEWTVAMGQFVILFEDRLPVSAR